MENESRPSGPEAWQERVASQPARLGASDGLRNEPQEVVIKPRKSAADNGLIGTFYLKRYRGTWLLLSFFILVLAVAALIFPRRPPADQPPPFGVLFEVTPATQTVTMTFTKMAAGNQYELAISLITVPESAALKRPAKVFAYISISLPPGVTLAGCKPATCSVRSIFGGVQYSSIVEYTNVFLQTAALNVTVTLNAPSSFAWNANGLAVEARLPEVFFHPYSGEFTGQDVGNPKVNIIYNMPGASAYSWTGSPIPLVATDTATWYLTSRALTNPTQISGINNNVMSQDNFRTFAAGALLGIAGGALVGAMQEATHTKRRRTTVTNEPAQ